MSSTVRNGGDNAPPGLGTLEKVVAVVLLLGFAAFIGVLIGLRGDANWDRMVFVFSGYEALVFAGVGALFGTQIQRGTVEAARSEAEQARAQAEGAEQRAGRADEQVEDARKRVDAAQGSALQAREHAESLAAQAQAGRSLAAAAHAELEIAQSRGTTPAERRGSREDVVGAPAEIDPSVVRLAALAGKLFPEA